jgi:hypothetical protein
MKRRKLKVIRNMENSNYARVITLFKTTNLQFIKLIKIDVEGFEKKVIKGLRATLKKERPILVCEITYGQRLSFLHLEELISYLPPDYDLFTFNTPPPRR